MNDCYSRCFTIDLFEEEKGFVEFSLPGMRKGFTLIELLIAVSIIAILISIGVVSYGSVNKRSRDAKRKGDIEQLRSGLEMYRADNGYYPNTGSGSWADASGLSTALVPTYLPSIPSDRNRRKRTGLKPQIYRAAIIMGIV